MRAFKCTGRRDSSILNRRIANKRTEIQTDNFELVYRATISLAKVRLIISLVRNLLHVLERNAFITILFIINYIAALKPH